MKRTITIEFDHTTVTTAHDRMKPGWCEICKAEAEFISETEAAHLAKFITAVGITIQREDMHFYRSGTGAEMICLNSILNGNYPKTNNQ